MRRYRCAPSLPGVRRTGVAVLLALVVLVAGTSPAIAAPAPPPGPTTTVAPPKSYVLVDADTGAVLAAQADRQPRPPASLTKVITALAASAALPHDGTLTISERAAAQPANKAGAKAGEVWPVADAMHLLLLQSANDLALAFAEAVGGTAEGFQGVMARTAAAVGMADPQIWRDPAGLDDEASLGGGNSVSARDLAIAGRALVADPWLSPISAKPRYAFTAPDGVGRDALNHNKLVHGRYPGAIGGKTGYTKRSGNSLFASAQRGGRTLVVVVLDTKDAYGFTTQLFDRGFATPVSAQGGLERLPPLRLPSASRILPPTPPSTAPLSGLATPAGAGGAGGSEASAASPGRPPLDASPVAGPGEDRGAVPLVAAGGSVLVVVLVAGYRHQARRRRRRGEYRVPARSPAR